MADADGGLNPKFETLNFMHLYAKGAEEGTLLEIRVVPGAKRSEIKGIAGGCLQVRVQAPPVGGKANQALLKLLARGLGIRKNRLRILSGERSRVKTILLVGVKPALAQATIKTILEGNKADSGK